MFSMNFKKIIILNIIICATLLLSGCDFFTPEDDLNGKNDTTLLLDKEIEINNSNLKSPQKSDDENEMDQLKQAVDQASYNLQKNETKTEVKEEPKENPNTDIESELLEYSHKFTKATIVTNFGEIKISFFNNDAPLATGNFIKLSQDNFYNDIKFHRVIKDFMIQAGDPNSKDDDWGDDGQGGPGYNFKDEPSSHKLVRGALAMANSGENTNGSQFFILTAESYPSLDGKHTVFGEVIDGMDIVDKIEKVKTNENDHPTDDVIIEKVELEE